MTTHVAACTGCGARNRVPVVAAGKPQCAKCHTPLPWLVSAGDDDFDAAVAGSVPVVVDLWAPWCGPCRMVAPALESLAADRAGQLKVVKVNVDEAPRVSGRFGVQSIPTLLLVRDGTVVARQVGALPRPGIERWLDTYLNGER